MLYYKRRSRQYAGTTEIEKVRIITRDRIVRAFAATFLDEPHRSTSYLPTLMDQLGNGIMHEDHKLEPYYAAAYAHYKLEFFWRNKQLDPIYKPGRWQALMAARHIATKAAVGAMSSKDISKNAKTLTDYLWDNKKALKLFKDAIAIVEKATHGNWRRDYMRNQPTTLAVVNN